MPSLSFRLPNSTHLQLKDMAQREGVSINQLILTAVAEKLSALRTSYYLNSLDSPISREEFEEALAQVPNVEPEPPDRWRAKVSKGS